MFGWRARIGVLVPPGNPTVEPEFYLMAPAGVTIHFARLQGFQSTGFAKEPHLIDRLASLTGTTSITAAHAVLTALQHLGVKKLALGTPYPEAISAKGKDFWEEAGCDIVGYHRLADVQNIYAENEQRAYQLARQANTTEADAVFLSGTGLPTVGVLDTLEQDLRKPVISSN